MAENHVFPTFEDLGTLPIDEVDGQNFVAS